MKQKLKEFMLCMTDRTVLSVVTNMPKRQILVANSSPTMQSIRGRGSVPYFVTLSNVVQLLQEQLLFRQPWNSPLFQAALTFQIEVSISEH